MTFKAKTPKSTVILLLTTVLSTTNIWRMYWILSFQMTKTFRDNCDIRSFVFPMFEYTELSIIILSVTS